MLLGALNITGVEGFKAANKIITNISYNRNSYTQTKPSVYSVKDFFTDSVLAILTTLQKVAFNAWFPLDRNEIVKSELRLARIYDKNLLGCKSEPTLVKFLFSIVISNLPEPA